MPTQSTMSQQLQALAHRDLRAIATRLNIRPSDAHHKAAFVQVIAAFWQTPADFEPALAALSMAARQALHQLALAGSLPAALFWQQYGALRPSQTHSTPPPWEQPATVSEELFYSALLHAADGQPMAKAQRLTALTGLDWRRLLAPAPTGQPDRRAWPLLHNMAQLLIHLHQESDSQLLHGRWLPPHSLARLNQRLFHPLPSPLPRSHKQVGYLRFLAFLAQAAALSDRHGLTALAWHWLAAAPTHQLQTLYDGWRGAPRPLRRAFAQPGWGLSAPWPQPLMAQLAQQAQPIAPADLAAFLLGQQPAWQTFFTANFDDIHELTRLLTTLLAQDLTWLGLLAADAAVAAVDGQPAYALTPSGAWLLGQTPHAPAITPPNAAAPVAAAPNVAETPAEPTAVLTIHQPDAWRLSWPAGLDFTLQARLAGYADYQTTDHRPESADLSMPQHHHLLSRYTVARAAARQQPLITLTDALGGAGVGLTDDQQHLLAQWHDDGRQIEIFSAQLLRTRRAAETAALWQNPHLQTILGELLSPTVSLLKTDAAAAIAHLRRSGYFTAPLPTPLPTPDSMEPWADLDDELTPTDVGGLWLAAQLYLHLGQHVALPPFISSTRLQQWLDQLPLAQQAALHSQLRQIQSHVATLLAGYTPAAPPASRASAAQVAQYRAAIERAIQAQQSLTIHYFTAGRNQLTQRTIEPYWIEEKHGVLYTRAYCCLAERDRLFRLDRIQAIA
ncbi:MAG: WYL domain-containing protein [Caldilineaceae bacterium]